VDAGPGEAAPAEVLSVETGVKILVNSPDIAKLDDADIIPPVHRNDDAMIVSILPADLSLLEKQIVVEPEAPVSCMKPLSPLVFDDDVSLVGRRLVSPDSCGFLGSVIHDMSLLENTGTLSARVPRGFVLAPASVTPGDVPLPRDHMEQLQHSTPVELRQTEAFDLADDAHGLGTDTVTDMVVTATAPIDDMATSPATAVEDFISSISAPGSPTAIVECLQSQLCSVIEVPILVEPPRLRAPRRRRAVAGPLSPPRRSGRLAAKSKCRVSNPTVQAQNVLMAKLGVGVQRPSAQTGTGNDYEEYLAMFDGPLSASKCEAIRALFPAGSAIDGIQLVEGVDLEV
jgi:hypothetical protein